MRSYKELIANLHSIPIHGVKSRDIYEDYLLQIENLDFLNNHIVFYPKNIFLEGKDLEVYFFTEETIHCLTFKKKGISVSTVHIDQITGFNLDIRDFVDAVLTIKLKDGDTIVLSNQADTDVSHILKTMFNSLIKTHELLLNTKSKVESGIK